MAGWTGLGGPPSPLPSDVTQFARKRRVSTRRQDSFLHAKGVHTELTNKSKNVESPSLKTIQQDPEPSMTVLDNFPLFAEHCSCTQPQKSIINSASPLSPFHFGIRQMRERDGWYAPRCSAFEEANAYEGWRVGIGGGCMGRGGTC